MIVILIFIRIAEISTQKQNLNDLVPEFVHYGPSMMKPYDSPKPKSFNVTDRFGSFMYSDDYGS